MPNNFNGGGKWGGGGANQLLIWLFSCHRFELMTEGKQPSVFKGKRGPGQPGVACVDWNNGAESRSSLTVSLLSLLSLAAMLSGAACQFCTGSFDLQDPFPRRWAVQRLFVTASLEQLALYVLNLTVMAALLPQDELKLVPILVSIFVLGR